jgi:hypothetical protein
MGTLVVDTPRLRAPGKPTAVGGATAIVVGQPQCPPPVAPVRRAPSPERSRPSQLLRSDLGAGPTSMIRSTSLRRTARRNGRRYPDRRLRAEGAERRRQQRPALRESGTTRRAGDAVAAAIVQRCDELRATQAISPIVPLRADAPKNRPAWTSASTARKHVSAGHRHVTGGHGIDHGRTESHMKMVKAVIRPDKVDSVMTPSQMGVSGMTISEARDTDGRRDTPRFTGDRNTRSACCPRCRSMSSSRTTSWTT